MFDDFMLRAMLASAGVAIAAAPLGCFVVWRRMAYFGDATAHAAVLGVALSLTMQTPIFVGVLCISLAMAVIVSSLTGRGFTMDTLLGVMSHSSLAFGLVAVSFLSGVRIDLMAYLFGDILAVGTEDLLTIGIGAALVLILMIWRWSSVLLSTINPDLARSSGINPKIEQLVLNISLALVVAVAIKIVGILLITALLLIPAATARPLSKTPEQMAIIAGVIGVSACLSGLQTSFVLDTPTGPTIVCVCATIFITVNALKGTVIKLIKAHQS